MAKKKNNILSQLPIHIRKKNSKWFVNSKTGNWIHTSQITKHLTEQTEVKPSWQNNYDNY